MHVSSVSVNSTLFSEQVIVIVVIEQVAVSSARGCQPLGLSPERDSFDVVQKWVVIASGIGKAPTARSLLLDHAQAVGHRQGLRH